MQPESQPPAPAVVAVVVTCDAGPWFEETLVSLAAQDYPNLSVLVIDAGSSVDPTPAVAAVLPGAFVRRLGRRVHFGSAANEVLSIVEGASHFLFCHDDVVLAPDAIRQLVEEAFRSNAGVVSPKYVLWDQPDHLLTVGATTDKVGVSRPLLDPGELDQEQHDSVREVLVAPGGALLVRADLFAALGGFDPAVDEYGEDLNLSWRARLAGARVMAVPAAKVRHLEATRHGVRTVPRKGASRRSAVPDSVRVDAHRYRTLLTCYRWYTLLWIVPLSIFWAGGEAVTVALQGKVKAAWGVLVALGGAVRDPGQLRSARRKVQKSRVIGDGPLRDLQVRGNTKLRGFLQTRFEGVRSGFHRQLLSSRFALEMYGPEPDADGREVVSVDPDAESDDTPVRNRKLTALLFLTLLVLLVLGSRSLLGSPFPQIGTLPDMSSGVGSIWRAWWSTWQSNGLGVGAPASPAIALLGVLSVVCFGAVGTAAHLAVLGPLVLGPWGAYRASRHWGSRLGRAAALISYAVVPLPYNAIAGGHWDGLVVYGVTPWVLSGVMGLCGAVPLPAVPLRRTWGRLLGVGLLVAVAASVAPAYLYVVALVGLLMLVGSVVAGRVAGAMRLFGLSVAAAVVALVLLVPWSLTVVGSKAALLGPDLGAGGRLGLGRVMRFDTGPIGGSAWEWLILAAAGLPLLVGREWRLEWAARMWAVVLGCFFVAWAGYRGWIPAVPIYVILAPAAAALAVSTALGAAAFEIDLPGYRFGWRQGAATVAAAALALAAVPFVVATGSGRWKLPSADASSVLAFLPNPHAGDYRVLWVGSPSALPLASRELEPGFGYAASYDGDPTLADDWTSGRAGASSQLSADLLLAQDRLTTKLGHLLGLSGVRYIILPNHNGPSGSGARAVASPTALLAGLGLQTDLQSLDVGDPDYTVYENSAWVPAKAVLPSSLSALASQPPARARRSVQQADVSGATPALAGGRPDRSSGELTPSSGLYVSMSDSSGWKLDVGGHSVKPTTAFGWAMSFEVPPSAKATVGARLTYSPPVVERIGYIFGVAVWVLAVVGALGERARRRRSGAPAEEVNPGWFAPSNPQGPPPRADGEKRSFGEERRHREAAGGSLLVGAVSPADGGAPAGSAPGGGEPDEDDDLWSQVTDV